MGLLYSNYECKNDLKINAVSGTLTKTFKDSYFINFKQGNFMEERIFSKNPKYCDIKVVVLQIMLCSNNYYLVEVIDKDEYDAMFEIGSDRNEMH